jgi:hypothetical protein
LNSVNRLIFVTVKCGVFFAVRTEFLYVTCTNLGFKEFNCISKQASVGVHGVHLVLYTEIQQYIEGQCLTVLAVGRHTGALQGAGHIQQFKTATSKI